MVSFHVKFVQTDRRMDEKTDNGKTIGPWSFDKGHKNNLKWGSLLREP